ncbi:type IVB secretion system protein IcmH/DotU [Marinobacterium arenosum]|uniref:type IVB secretion system protein IcmH/DotU n=1 Tax=Marinobacterium arenosum TaxID=2862496 RepID=UPI001C94E1C4|nr:type IVB secretion system protein IcmH/DotU [Marinobacterium arenosum]MBY4677073.1 type IVB secretion system protein IcmH/DotU [Marinobacterium arenosum]
MAMDYLDEATVEVAQPTGNRDDAGQSRALLLAGAAPLKNQQRNLHELQQFASYDNQLLNAGAELLSLCVTVSRMPQPDDLHRFRHGLISSISELKQRIAALDYPPSVADKTCFLFCIVLDEMILHSEWGESCGWENQTLLSELFGVRDGGEQFYRVADKALSQPNLLIDLLELIYLFLKVGFRGQYHLSGRERLDALYHQIESVVLTNRPRVPFTTVTPVELSKVRKPGRPAHFGRQALLFFAGVALSWGAASYWYQNSYDQRARDFLGLPEFSKQYLDVPEEEEVVYVSTPEEMARAARAYGRPAPAGQSAPQPATSAVGAPAQGQPNWIVQLATFDQQALADRFLAENDLHQLGARVEPWNNLYRVLIPAGDRQQAKRLAEQARGMGIRDAFIISK